MRSFRHVLAFVVPCGVLLAAFSLLTPVASGPDEQSHYYHAYRAVRGQLHGDYLEVPNAVANLEQYRCLAHLPDVTGACDKPYHGPAGQKQVFSYTGNYNPVYYLWVGLPTLIWHAESGVYAARLMSAAVAAVLLGWTASLLVRRRSRWPGLAMLVAWTPMTSYLASVVNPSGWEITGAMAFTVGGWMLLHDERRRWSEAHTLAGIGGVLFVLSRGISPEYGLMIVVALAICAGWSRLRQAVHGVATRVVGGVVALAAVASLLWTIIYPPTYVGIYPPATLLDGLKDIPRYYSRWWIQTVQYVGNTGWLDQPISELLVAIWLAIVIALLALAYLVASRRVRIVLVGGVVAVLTIPAVLQGMLWGGVMWQGRYTLPLVCALVVIAGLWIAESPRPVARSSEFDEIARQARWAVPVFFWVAQMAMVGVTVERMSVGHHRSWFAAPTWEGPLGIAVPLTAVGVALAVIAALVVYGTRHAVGDPRDVGGGVSATDWVASPHE